MTRVRAIVAAGAITGSMLIGGVAGAALTSLATVTANAATASPATTASPAATASPGTGTGAAPDTFKPNEDPAHEASESAAREAQEDAGQVPNIP